MREEYDFSQGKRGPVIPPQRGKTRITIRIDNDILEWFRQKVHAAGGGNYQTMINDALRQHMQQQDITIKDVMEMVSMITNALQLSPVKPNEIFENKMRRVFREEIQDTRFIHAILSHHSDKSE